MKQWLKTDAKSLPTQLGRHWITLSGWMVTRKLIREDTEKEMY